MNKQSEKLFKYSYGFFNRNSSINKFDFMLRRAPNV